MDVHMDDIVKWQVFMAHINHSEKDYLMEQLTPFKYLFGLEDAGYEHIHFLVEMSDKDYHSFSKRVFKDKYQLRGRATKGAPRQYGKEKKIRDIQKVARYTCKDKNVITNIDEAELEDILGQKLEECENTKSESMDNIKKCCQFVEKKIRDIQKVARYTCKDKNVITNIDEAELEDILGQKLEECENTKSESMDNIKKCCQFVENQIYGEHLVKDKGGQQELDESLSNCVILNKVPSIKEIKIQIILWMRREKMNIRKTTIETYYLYIVAQSEHLNRDSYHIYDYLYGD